MRLVIVLIERKLTSIPAQAKEWASPAISQEFNVVWELILLEYQINTLTGNTEAIQFMLICFGVFLTAEIKEKDIRGRIICL